MGTASIAIRLVTSAYINVSKSKVYKQKVKTSRYFSAFLASLARGKEIGLWPYSWL